MNLPQGSVFVRWKMHLPQGIYIYIYIYTYIYMPKGLRLYDEKCTASGVSISTFVPARQVNWAPACRKRFRAVNTTVADTLSGSTKARAFVMAMKISRSMAGGAPLSLSHSEMLILSMRSTYSCPSRMAGTSARPKRSFSGHDIKSLFLMMAASPWKGPERSSQK